MYRPAGYYELTDAEVLIPAALELKALGEARLREIIDIALRRLGTGNSRYATFDVSMIMEASGEGREYRNLAIVLHKLLVHNKRANFELPRIAYRRDPSVEIDEAITLALNDELRFAPLPAMPTLLTQQVLRSYLMLTIEELARLADYRAALIMRLREYANHIAWMIQHGAAISQEQKSFFMHMTYHAYNTSRIAGDETFKPPTPVEIQTNDATNIFQRVMTHTRPGPKMNYLKLVSNANLESLMAYFGLYAPTLIVSAGSILPFGGFKRLKLEKIETITWDIQRQLQGSIDALSVMQAYPPSVGGTGLIENGGTPQTFAPDLQYPMLQVGLDKGGIDSPIRFVPDLPQVTLVWRGDRYLMQYFSEWRGRFLELDNSSEILLDHMLRMPQVGEAQVARLSVDEWPIADLSFFETSEGAKQLEAYDTECTALYVRGTEKKLLEAPIDMRPFHMNLGKNVVKPALAEYYRPVRGELLEPRPDAVRYLRTRIGLNETDWQRSEMALLISYNWYRMNSLFRKPPSFVREKGETPFAALRKFVSMMALGGGE